MPNATTEATQAATTAVDEATRITTQASRQTAENARAAVTIARAWADEASTLNKQLVGAYFSGLEASLSATFDVQNAAFAASLPLYDAVVKSNRGVLDQVGSAVRQTQEATLQGLKSSARTTQKLFGAIEGK